MKKRKKSRFPNVEQLPGSGLWRYDKLWNGLRLRSPAIFASPEEAFAALQESLKAVMEGLPEETPEPAPIPTFGELAKEWIEKVVPATCKSSTASDYRRILAGHVLPVFGDRAVSTINRKDVKLFFLDKLNAGLARSTVIHVKNVVSGVLNLAVEGEILDVNVALRVGSLGKPEPRGEKVNPFTAEELSRLLATMKEKWPREYPLTAVLALTGLRAGEALGLTWNDVDFERGVIHVRQSFSRNTFSTPKSGKTRRVDMGQALAEILRDHRIEQKRATLARGWGRAPELCFVNEAAGPMDLPSWRRRCWEAALEAAGLPHRRIHDLRHTYATLRISAGDNVADVSAQLGHHSVKFTLDEYYHWLPSIEGRAQVDALARRVVG